MLETKPGTPCVLCGAPPARWNEPASAEDPEAACEQVASLERCLAAIEAGRVDVRQLHRDMLRMCAMCQEVVLDADRPEMKGEVVRRLRFRIDALRRLVREAKQAS
jgi:hypothetical protein